MGIANFMRDRKKTIAIVASLSLGGICLLIIASALLTRSPKQYARQFFPDGDYEIYLDSEKSEIELMTGGNPFDDRLKEEILSIDGVTDIIEKREAFIGKAAVSEVTPVASMCDILDEENEQEAELALVKGSMPADKDEILIAESVYQYLGRFADVKVGQTMELTVEQKTVLVTLAGTFDTKKVTNGHGSLAMDSTQVFLSRDLAQGLFPEIENFDYSWNIVSDPQKAQSVEAGLKSVAANHRDLALWKFAESLEYEEMQSRIMFGSMQALSWLIFLFGVINLINTTLSNQISRKRENSILRSIGLTGKQLCKMNICEGLCYALFTALAVLLAGLPIAVVVSREISKIAFAGKIVPYQFPVLEMGLFLLALFVVELILSVWMVHRQKKQSLIEQMRAL
jgi:putative ABC transport system permease protein